MSINTVSISGNITRDPEIRASGETSILMFSVAVNDRRKNKTTGEWEDSPNFFDCKLFGSRADSLQKYLAKGTKVMIHGKLNQRTWEKDGVKKSAVDIVVNEIEFFNTRTEPKPEKPQASFAGQELYFDEDVPF